MADSENLLARLSSDMPVIFCTVPEDLGRCTIPNEPDPDKAFLAVFLTRTEGEIVNSLFCWPLRSCTLHDGGCISCTDYCIVEVPEGNDRVIYLEDFEN